MYAFWKSIGWWFLTIAQLAAVGLFFMEDLGKNGPGKVTFALIAFFCCFMAKKALKQSYTTHRIKFGP